MFNTQRPVPGSPGTAPDSTATPTQGSIVEVDSPCVDTAFGLRVLMLRRPSTRRNRGRPAPARCRRAQARRREEDPPQRPPHQPRGREAGTNGSGGPCWPLPAVAPSRRRAWARRHVAGRTAAGPSRRRPTEHRNAESKRRARTRAINFNDRSLGRRRSGWLSSREPCLGFRAPAAVY